MRIIGIDPGIAITGWAIVDIKGKSIGLVDFGVITTEKTSPHSERLEETFKDLTGLLKKYKPEVAGVETLLFAKNMKTAMSVGQARGVILLALEQAKLEIREFTPLQVKIAIAGYGRADKKQVQENVMRFCGLDEVPKPDDAADAIAIAICAGK